MSDALVKLAGAMVGAIFGISFKVFLYTVVAVKTLEWLEVLQ